MLKRILAILLVLLLLPGILPAAHATALVPCMTVDDTLLIIGDSNVVCLQGYNPDLAPARIYARSSARIDECVERWSSSYAYGYDSCIYDLLSALSGEDYQTVVINLGTNNIGWSMSKFRSDYAKLLNNLFEKNPSAVIYVCKILPTNPAHCNSAFNPETIGAINERVVSVQEEYAALGYDVRVMDLNTPFADSDGILLAEYDNGGGIHMTANGYRKLDKVVQTILAQGNPNANHSWGEEAVIVREPSCAVPGARAYTCTVCGGVKTEEIPVNASHVWDSGTVTQEPSCTKSGKKLCTCKICRQATKTFTVPALGHAWKLSAPLTAAGDGEIHGQTVAYSCTRCGETKQAQLCAAEIFRDMPKEGNWAHAPIDWAYFHGITGGTSYNTFSPKGSCNRAQVVTFLWAAAGRPAPESTDCAFTDVKPTGFYYKAVLWACENGITGGKSATRFAPKATCTRAEVMTFLWAAQGRPEPAGESCAFTDVKTKAYYYKAVLWACELGLTGGVTPTTFGPGSPCTRAQVVTFLYKLAAQ